MLFDGFGSHARAVSCSVACSFNVASVYVQWFAADVGLVVDVCGLVLDVGVRS